MGLGRDRPALGCQTDKQERDTDLGLEAGGVEGGGPPRQVLHQAPIVPSRVAVETSLGTLQCYTYGPGKIPRTVHHLPSRI